MPESSPRPSAETHRLSHHHHHHHRIDDEDGGSIARRVSALEEAPGLVPPLGFPAFHAARRRSNASQYSHLRDPASADHDDILSLTRSVSQISGHDASRAFPDHISGLPPQIARPKAAKPGPETTIREIPAEMNVPLSTQPSSPVDPFLTRPSSPLSDVVASDEVPVAQGYPDVGRIASWRGALILLVTCGAQLMDNVFMTGTNIALPAIQRSFDVSSADLQWLISAYTLTFGGFLLLAGVMSDRYGRKHVFCAGMLTLSVWTLADGLAASFIQLAIFRALQGIGAAMTVPSAVGIISNYFVAQDRTLALTVFGAAGAVGFCLGLVFGGFLTSGLGWRYIFYVSVAVTGTIGLLGLVFLPRDRREGTARPQLDFIGAGLSTGGLILLSFVLSSGGVYGWGKAFIIVLLVLSVAMLAIFTWVEKKVPNPIMPLSLWRIQNFGALWVAGFVMYGAYQTLIYYTTLIAQDINKLSAGGTALRFLPMGATGFTFSLSMSRILPLVPLKPLLLFGLLLCVLAPLPPALLRSPSSASFWTHVFPATLLSVAGTTVVYCTLTVVLLASVPVNVKSLAGGMVNTAFQIGSGVGLALATAVSEALAKKKGDAAEEGALAMELDKYTTGLWCCVGFAGLGVVVSLFGIRDVGKIGGAEGEGERHGQGRRMEMVGLH